MRSPADPTADQRPTLARNFPATLHPSGGVPMLSPCVLRTTIEAALLVFWWLLSQKHCTVGAFEPRMLSKWQDTARQRPTHIATERMNA